MQFVDIDIWYSCRNHFANASTEIDAAEEELDNVSQRILLTNVSLAELDRKVNALHSAADDLKDRAINLQQSNVEGKQKHYSIYCGIVDCDHVSIS